MVIVEGCDGCGKTTLVHDLANEFGLEVGERGVANRDFLYKVTRQDTYRALSVAVMAASPPCIWDRLFVSEFVYADIVGRPCEFKPFERDFVVSTMNALGCPMVICLPPLDVVKANIAKGPKQMSGVNENLEEIYRRYDEDDLPWPQNTVHYDYTQSDPRTASREEVMEEVAGYLDTRTEREAWA